MKKKMILSLGIYGIFVMSQIKHYIKIILFNIIFNLSICKNIERENKNDIQRYIITKNCFWINRNKRVLYIFYYYYFIVILFSANIERQKKLLTSRLCSEN